MRKNELCMYLRLCMLKKGLVETVRTFKIFLGTNVVGATSLEDMVTKLKKPRRVMLLVKAGNAVDAFIQKLV